jgi:hypothetical protein
MCARRANRNAAPVSFAICANIGIKINHRRRFDAVK